MNQNNKFYLFPGRATPEYYIEKAAEKYGITEEEMMSKSRKEKLVEARYMAMTNIKENFPKMSLAAIGKLVAGKGHVTVMYGINKYKLFKKTNQLLIND